MWRHPKYYKDLRKLARLRNRDEAISSGSEGSALPQRAPDPGPKASSSKPHAASVKHQAVQDS